MEWWRIALALGLVLLIAWLSHAGNVLGRNPYLRIKMHEDLAGGKLPQDMSFEEKQTLLDRGGLSGRGVWRTAMLIAAVGLAVLLYLLLTG
jgi:hypothetical protein